MTQRRYSRDRINVIRVTPFESLSDATVYVVFRRATSRRSCRIRTKAWGNLDAFSDVDGDRPCVFGKLW